MTVTSSFVAGTLSVSSDAADDIAITHDGVNVLVSVNGAAGINPGGGPAVAANTVTSLQINGYTGNFDNVVDLTKVIPTLFTSMQTIDIDAGDGNDTTVLGATLNTTLGQTYADAVVLTAVLTLRSTGGGDIRFLSTIDSDGVQARSLGVSTTGLSVFGDGGADYIGAVNPLREFATFFTAKTIFNMADTLQPTVSTTGIQAYRGVVELASDTHLEGNSFYFFSGVDSQDATPRSLVLDGGNLLGGVGADFGANFALSSITSNSNQPLTIDAGVTFHTTGDQAFNHALELQGAGIEFVADAGTLTFGGPLTGTPANVLADADKVIINGTASDETLTLGHTGGVPSFTFDGVTHVLYPTATSFEFNGGGGDDALVVNYAGGNPIPTGGLLFDGGAQGPNGDRLAFNGAGNSASYQPSATTSGAGKVTVGGRTVDFTGLEPVDITGMATVNITPAGADDVLTVATGFDFATGVIPALRVSGTTGGVPIETVALWNNGTVSINTSTNNGNDTITINSANNAHGNTNFTIVTGTGTDKIDVNGPVVVTGDVNFASQQINLASSLSATNVALNAGGGAIADLNAAAINILALNFVATASTGIEADTTVDVINANVTGAGGINLRETDAVVVINATTANGSIDVIAGGAMTATNVVAGGTSRDIDLETTAGNISVVKVTALADTVRLTTPGSITDGNGAAVNVSAGTLIAMSATGINLDTTVDQINASVSATGAILFRETDAVVLNNVTTADGLINVLSGGAMTATNVVAGGAARDVDLKTNAGNIVAGTITALSDTVRLTAAASISDGNAAATNVAANKLVAVAGSGIDLDTAVAEIDATVSGVGSILIRELDAVTLNTVTTADGSIDVIAGGMMTASSVVAGGTSKDIELETTAGNLVAVVITALGDTVRLTAQGSIVDGNGAATNVMAATLIATAGTGIDLDTAVAQIDANVSGAGSVQIGELDAVVLNNVTTTNGDINVIAGGAMTVTFVSAGGAGHDTDLKTTSGGMAVVVANAVDTVTLISAANITDINPATPNVTANSLVATAISGITLVTDVALIDARTTGTGAIVLEEVSAVTLNPVQTADGLIDVVAGGNITATLVTAGGASRNITIRSTGGAIGVWVITAAADRIDLTAAASITDLNGVALNLSSRIAIFIAGGGIGTTADPLETTINELEAASGPGGVFLDNTGTLIIGKITPTVGVSSSSGDIDIQTTGAMFILEDIVTTTGDIRLSTGESAGIGEQLVLANKAKILSNTGDIFLSAGDDVDLHMQTRVATAGKLFIASDVGDLDPQGTFIKLDGVIATGFVDMTAGDDDDMLIINETVAGQFNFSGAAPGGHTNAAFQASGRAPGNVGMHFEAGLGNDSMAIFFTLPQDVAYFSDTNEPNSGVINVLNNYTMSFDGLEPLRLSGATGSLLIDATSTPGTTFLNLDDNGVPDDGFMVVTADGGVEQTTFGGFTNLKLRGGDGAETFNILGFDTTKPLGLGGPLANVDLDGSNTQGTDAAGDVFNIRVLPGNIGLRVFGGLGNDLINVSSDAPTNLGSIDPIDGPLYVDGQGGSDTLVVNDKGDPTNDVATLTSSTLTGMGLATGISFANIDQLDVFFGLGRDELVLMLPLPSPVQAPLPSLIRIQGGPDDQDRLTVIGTNNANVADEAVVGTFGSSSPIQIQEVERLQMFGYAGPDRFVNNTSVPSFLVGGDGPDTLQGGSSIDSIFGGGELDQLFGNDADDYLYPDHDIVGGLIVERITDGDVIDGGNGFDSVLSLGFGDLLRFIGQSIDNGSIQDVITWLRGQFIPDTPAGRTALLNAGLVYSNSGSIADPALVPPPPPVADLSGVVFDPNLFVQRAYFDYLDRNPALDPGGVQQFTAKVVAGATIEQVRSEILGSAEYFSKGGNTTNAGFITNLYADLLLRAPSQADINTWVGVLASGASRADVALLILVTQEARNVQIGEIYDHLDDVLFNGLAPPPGANDVDRLAMLADFANGLTIAQAERQLRAASLAGKLYADSGVGDASSFVVDLYRSPAVLGREPTAAELAPWLTALANGTMSRKFVAFSILSSVEKRTRDVERIYQSFLGRGVDPPSLDYALAFLNTGGRIESLEVTVLGSQEYFQQQGGTNQGFVAALYLDALGRAGTAGEITQFTASLNGGMARGQLASIFVNSTEARTRVINQQYLQTAGRLPTPTELATGLERFGKGETRDQVLLRLILGSGFTTN